MPDIKPLHYRHPRILAKLPGQLAVAHIHSIHPLRTVLQKTICESARGCARIQAGKSRDIDLKSRQGVFQLQPPRLT
jgi:hypothetical protein